MGETIWPNGTSQFERDALAFGRRAVRLTAGASVRVASSKAFQLAILSLQNSAPRSCAMFNSDLDLVARDDAGRVATDQGHTSLVEEFGNDGTDGKNRIGSSAPHDVAGCSRADAVFYASTGDIDQLGRSNRTGEGGQYLHRNGGSRIMLAVHHRLIE
jgi:hypothetical protein